MTVLTVPDTRQYPLIAFAEFEFSDLTDAVGVALFALPQNAVVIDGNLQVLTVLTGSSTVTVELGDSAASARYLAAADVKSAVVHPELLNPGFHVTQATRNFLAEVNLGGTLTAGTAQVSCEYIVIGRATENYE